MKISFVIPCYYSGQTLDSIVKEIGAIIGLRKNYDYEIVLVNDGSQDGTFELIKNLCASNHKIKGINLSKNFGQANATLAGLAHTTGDFVIYADDDGQSPIDEVWKLIDKINEGHDIVFAKYKVTRNSLFQKFGSRINNIMANILIGKPKNLHMGSFWVARKFIIDEIINCNNPYPYIGGLFLKATSNIVDVLTEHRERSVGKSNYTLRKMISLWLNGFTAFSIMPLRLATLMGSSCSVLGFISAIVVVVNKLKNPDVLIGYSSIMATILFVGGMIMVMLGVIGEYIGRVYMNLNKIPQYVVKERVNMGVSHG